jgi:hypothetical protein
VLGADEMCSIVCRRRMIMESKITTKRYREIYQKSNNNTFKLLFLLCAELTGSEKVSENSIVDYLKCNIEFVFELVRNIEEKEVKFYDKDQPLSAEEVETVERFIRENRKDSGFYNPVIDGPDSIGMGHVCGEKYAFYISRGFEIHPEVYDIAYRVLKED